MHLAPEQICGRLGFTCMSTHAITAHIMLAICSALALRFEYRRARPSRVADALGVTFVDTWPALTWLVRLVAAVVCVYSIVSLIVGW